MAKGKTQPQEKLVRAALEMAAEGGWRTLTLSEVARRAGLTMAETYKVAADKEAILDLYAQGIDASLADWIAEAGDEAGSWRDRIFDAVMARFDFMLKDRDALRVVIYESRRDPLALARAARRNVKSMERLLDSLALGGDAIARKVRAALLAGLVARTARVWLNDDDDQARTMADLDRRLQRAERLLARARPITRRFTAEPEPPVDIASPPPSETKH